jgi:hypothetical protein
LEDKEEYFGDNLELSLTHNFILTVRNIFSILGYHKRHNTTQKSRGKANFTSAGGCTPESLKASTWAGSPQKFYLMTYRPWIGQFGAHSLHGWLNKKGSGWEGAFGTKKFKSSGIQ